MATSQDVINAAYVQALGRPADPEGLSFYAGQLESGAKSVGDILADLNYAAATGVEDKAANQATTASGGWDFAPPPSAVAAPPPAVTAPLTAQDLYNQFLSGRPALEKDYRFWNDYIAKYGPDQAVAAFDAAAQNELGMDLAARAALLREQNLARDGTVMKDGEKTLTGGFFPRTVMTDGERTVREGSLTAQDLYKQFLGGRSALPADIDFWNDYIAVHGPDKARAAFQESAKPELSAPVEERVASLRAQNLTVPGSLLGEFATQRKATPAEVRSMYLSTLGREPDPEGFSYWTSQPVENLRQLFYQGSIPEMEKREAAIPVATTIPKPVIGQVSPQSRGQSVDIPGSFVTTDQGTPKPLTVDISTMPREQQDLTSFIVGKMPRPTTTAPGPMFTPGEVNAQLELERLKAMNAPSTTDQGPVAGFAEGGLVGNDINRMLQNQRNAIQRESQSRRMLTNLGAPPVKKFSDGGPAGSSSGVRRLKMSGYQEGGDVTDEMFVGTRPEDFPETSSVDKKAGELLRALSEGTRGFVGAEPIEPGSEAYRTGQALANMPAVGVVAATAKGAGKAKDALKALTKKDIKLIASELETSRGQLAELAKKYPQLRDASVADIEALTKGEPFTAFRGISLLPGRELRKESTPSMTVDPSVALGMLKDAPVMITKEGFITATPVLRQYPGMKASETQVYVPSLIEQITERQPGALEMKIPTRSGEKMTVADVFKEVKGEKELLADVSKKEPRDILFDRYQGGVGDRYLMEVARRVLAGKWDGGEALLKEIGGYQTDPKGLVQEFDSFAELVKESALKKAQGGEVTNDEFIQEMMVGTRPTDLPVKREEEGVSNDNFIQEVLIGTRPSDFPETSPVDTAVSDYLRFQSKAVTDPKAYMQALGENIKKYHTDPLQQDPQKYLMEQIGPGVLAGTVGKAAPGTAEFIKQSLAKEFEAPPVGAVTLKPDALTDLETAAPAAGGASIRPEQLDQLTSQTVIRGQDIPPLTKIPTPEEIRVAKADTRMGQNIVADRLNIIVPETERVRGGIYRAGQPSGRPWSELTPEQLKQRDSGFKGTDNDLDKMWQETLSEVSEAGRIAVERTGATWKAFPARNWNNAFKLPLRNQLWYELSGEAFVDRMPDTTTREMLTFLDLIGATSARAKPLENLERSVAISAQKLQGVPVDVDVTIPSTVKDALRREGTNISSDLANKTGNFSDTLALTGGLPVRYPISVNDVWVGNAFGITDQQLGANQALHEVFARYMNKVRDFHNETGNPLYPHESWQVQARQWVEMRANALGIDTSKLDTVEGSDYAAEFDKVVKKLENAGISVPDGILTRDVLLDPRVPDALRATTKAFREAPKATVEFGTLLTPSGKRGAELFEAAKAAGDELTQKEYLKVLTSSMYDSARGKPTPWQNLIRVATNRAESVTRIYSPTSQDPFAISGTFQGAAGPNIRIPFRDMTPDQIAYANAVAGSGLKQKAMAAAEIRRLTPGEALPEGFVSTNSLKFDIDGPVPESLLVDITKELGEGYEVSAMRYPDSIVVDINPKFGDAGPEAPDIDNIDRAVDMLRERYGARDPRVFNSGFRSEFGKNYVEDPGTGTEYNRIIQETLKGWNDEAITRITDLAGNGVKRSDISKFLAGKLDTLPVNSKQLPEGVALSSVRGRAETIRKQLRQRVSDHNAAVEAFASIGQSVDGAMAKAIPTWEKRAQSQRKKLTTASTAQPVARRRGKGTTSAAEDLAAVSPTAPAGSRVEKTKIKKAKGGEVSITDFIKRAA